MSHAKHVDTPADFELPYEENDVGLKGIVYFGVGLFLLIVITFGLMWAFLGSLEEYMTVKSSDPMAMNDIERLPPEPRLQSAPGFGIEGKNGRVNLELMIPQAEFRELQKQWADVWEHGEVDSRTGTMIALPIDMAKEKFLESNVKAKTGDQAEALFADSHKFISDASSGRMASETRR